MRRDMKKYVILMAVLLTFQTAGAQIPSKTGFWLQAHRGLCNRYPENSLIAFRQAGKAGVFYGMETDIQMTSDGVLVCMHDETIDRTVNATGKVSDYTYRELMGMRLDGGRGWNDRYAGKLKIPTFRQYLRICRKYKLVPYVEMKNLPDEGVKKAVDILSEMGFDGSYVLTSFYFRNLTEAARYTDAPLEYMRPSYEFSHVDKCMREGNFVIRASAVKITKELVDYAHSKGFAVECFGLPVGGADVVENLISLGVLGGTCDDYEGLGL